MYLSDLVSSLLSIAAPSEPLAMSVSPPDDAELESSRVADDAARASIFTSEKFWPIFLNHLKKIGGSMNVGWRAADAQDDAQAMFCVPSAQIRNESARKSVKNLAPPQNCSC